MALYLKNSAVAVQLNSFGAATNLDQTNLSNFRCGLADTAEDRPDGLSIQHCVPSSHTSSINGKMHLLKF